MPRGIYIRTKEYREKQRQAMLRRFNPGKNKSEKTKKKIGDKQRGVPKSEEFKEKCRKRLIGKPSFFKGHKQSEYQKLVMRSMGGKKHYNWKGGYSIGINRSRYSVNLRREKMGFTEDVFNSRIKEQNNKCAICNIEFDESKFMQKKSADHCHLRNIPRGILCRKCNTMLGQASDNIAILAKAIEYLNYWSGGLSR